MSRWIRDGARDRPVDPRAPRIGDEPSPAVARALGRDAPARPAQRWEAAADPYAPGGGRSDRWLGPVEPESERPPRRMRVAL
jgi:hypothetical protein